MPEYLLLILIITGTSNPSVVFEQVHGFASSSACETAGSMVNRMANSNAMVKVSYSCVSTQSGQVWQAPR